ncbi:MAG: hypothetical protein K8S21_00920 [Gemmatimonadetes bacterium]|nr:hypothetical protein [Gemmatimonadota bacterium]
MSRRRAAIALIVVVLGAVACQDPFKLTAQSANIDAGFELWAMSGSPASFPSGLLVPQASVVRLDAAGSFDLAFDIDGNGRLMVLPVSSVVSPIAGSRQIAFQRAPGIYNSLLEAPADGWTNDTLFLVNEGQSFYVKVTTQFCQYDVRQDIYAKFYVDSVVPVQRRIKLSARVNPNCGFRALTSGVPEF